VHYYDGEYSGLAEKLEKMHEYKDIQVGMSKNGYSTAPPDCEETEIRRSLDAPPCQGCGTITQRNGSCYLCPGCGNSTGCS